MTTLVVGVGHPDRGDDGVGPYVARELLAAWSGVPPPGVEVLVWSGDPLGLLDRLAGVDRLVLIDAVVTGAAPGTVQRFAADAPFVTAPAASSHGIGLAEALALGRALGRLPPAVEVWGVEATAFAAGAAMTPAVAAAGAAVAARLVRSWGAGAGGAGAEAP